MADAAAAAPKEKKAAAGGGAPVKKANVNLDTMKPPEFWADRVALFDKLYAEQCAAYAAKSKDIKVTLPDGKAMEAKSWVTTPLDIAKRISNSLGDKVIVAKVNDDTLWDLARPLEADCQLELLDWDYPEARNVFWHSSAHVLGYAIERVYGAILSTGPALEEGGFFYEGDTKRPVTEADYGAVEAAMGELVKQKMPYQRLVLSKENALKMFGYNTFKQRTLGKKVPEGGACTAYKCGNLIDPCRGPHLPDTGRVKAFAVMKNSSSFFQGNADNEVLQRIYGISFPQEKQLKEYKALVEEAAKRDHRTIGKQQELFHFHEVSPGSGFWTPHGARIYNALIEFQRKNYRQRGFEEVITPNMYNSKLWEVSGHWGFYKDAMFRTIVEHEEYALKPMNCPGHCIMFTHRPHSYKELPLRWADFGTLHRNELSGALTGLTRVRRFQQDDAHVFCRLDQVVGEIERALDFLKYVYGVLDWSFYLKLSTKPENALGDAAVWEKSERYLLQALNAFCRIPEKLADPTAPPGATFVYDGSVSAQKKMKRLVEKLAKDGADKVGMPGWEGPAHTPWELNPGDGAFYGPKIDIVVEDALKRKHQCATIQLDFNLPNRFGLKYTMKEAKEKTGDTEASGMHKADGPATPVVPGELPATHHGASAPVHKDPAAAGVPPTPPTDASGAASFPSSVAGEHPAGSQKPGRMKELNLQIDRHLNPNEERPVMIHRAIFGSLERSIAILCEHYGGKWPFWLSPRQALVVTVDNPDEKERDRFAVWGREVKDAIYGEGFHAELDDSELKLPTKIKHGQQSQFNFILVVGEKECAEKTVNIRTRAGGMVGSKTLPEVQKWFAELRDTYNKEF